MKKIMIAVPVFLMVLCFAVAGQATDNAKIADVNVGVATAVGSDGTIYVLKEFKVDIVTEFSLEEVAKMKQEMEADINKIIEYKLINNKADATAKEKKAALKGIEDIIEKRVDAYFDKFQEKIDYVKAIVKEAEAEYKAESKNKKAFISQEAKDILSEKAPLFRLPELNETEKVIAEEINAKKEDKTSKEDKKAVKEAEKQQAKDEKEAAKAAKEAEAQKKKDDKAAAKALKESEKASKETVKEETKVESVPAAEAPAAAATAPAATAVTETAAPAEAPAATAAPVATATEAPKAEAAPAAVAETPKAETAPAAAAPVAEAPEAATAPVAAEAPKTETK